MIDPISDIPEDLRLEALQLGRRSLRRLIEFISLCRLTGMSDDAVLRALSSAGCSEPFAEWILSKTCGETLERETPDEAYLRRYAEKLLERPPLSEDIARLTMTATLAMLSLLLVSYASRQAWSYDGRALLYCVTSVFAVLGIWLLAQTRSLWDKISDAREVRRLQRR